jgi:hypothetical protein
LSENQCIFVRGYRIKLNTFTSREVVGAAEPKPDPREEKYELEKELISVPSVSEVRSLSLTFQPSYMCFKYRDPLHVLLDYILKVSTPDRFRDLPR